MNLKRHLREEYAAMIDELNRDVPLLGRESVYRRVVKGPYWKRIQGARAAIDSGNILALNECKKLWRQAAAHAVEMESR